MTWQNPEQLFVAQELINKVKSKCCGIKAEESVSLLSDEEGNIEVHYIIYIKKEANRTISQFFCLILHLGI